MAVVRILPFVLLIALLSSCAAKRDPSPTFHNPLLRAGAADPGVLHAEGACYVYTTSGWEKGGSYRIYQSLDGTDWRRVGYIFRIGHYPSWSGGFDFWAPEVHRVGDRYIAYFTIRNKEGRFCVGAATAPHPLGPFEDVGAPIFSNPDVGLIDVTYFRDPRTDRSWLAWKEDSNALRGSVPTSLILQEVAADGLTPIGAPTTILRNDAPWEGALVEAPSFIHQGGYYYLFYSANAFFDDRYAVGVARARRIEGPYEKNPANPILRSDDRFSGPGHQFLIEHEPGEWTMFYHARDKSTKRKARLLMSDPVKWTRDGWPSIQGGVPSSSWSRTPP